MTEPEPNVVSELLNSIQCNAMMQWFNELLTRFATGLSCNNKFTRFSFRISLFYYTNVKKKCRDIAKFKSIKIILREYHATVPSLKCIKPAIAHNHINIVPSKHQELQFDLG